MNIFKTRGDIIGRRNEAVETGSLNSFLSFAKQLRGRLDKKGYLLDTYLSLFFDAVNQTLSTVAAEDGFLAAEHYKELDIGNLTASSESIEGDSAFAKRVLVKYPFISSFQEPLTRKNLLYALTADEILADSTKVFADEQENSIANVMDIVRFQEIYELISIITGEQMAEELNCRLKQTFLATQLIPMFRQAFMNDLLFKLTWRDPETSRQVFQLLLDNLPQ